ITFYPAGAVQKGTGTTAYAWFVWDKGAREPGEVLQATAMDPAAKRREPALSSAALTDVPTDDLASPKSVVSVPDGLNSEPLISAVAPAGRDSFENAVVLANVSAAEVANSTSIDAPAPHRMRGLGSLF